MGNRRRNLCEWGALLLIHVADSDDTEELGDVSMLSLTAVQEIQGFTSGKRGFSILDQQ